MEPFYKVIKTYVSPSILNESYIFFVLLATLKWKECPAIALNFKLYLFYNNNIQLQIGYEVILLGGE